MESARAFFDAHFTVPLAWPWAAGVALVVVLLLELFNRQMFSWLQRLVALTNTTLDDVLVERMRVPAQVLVFLIGAHVLFAVRGGQSAVASKIVTIVELLLVAYLTIETLETAVLHYWLGERKKVQVPNVVRHLILIVVYTVTGLSIVSGVTGVNVAPLLATSTVISVVLGLALQDTLGNLFAGFALSLDKPFKEGEWVLVDGVEGCVEHMGWRSTTLRTFTRDVVVIPNSLLGKARIQNFDRPQKMTGRNVEVAVALHARPEDVEQAMTDAIAKVPAILRSPAPKAWFVATTPLFHRYVIRFWLEDFSIHDDAESDFMKAFFHELSLRRIALVTGGAVPVSDVEGRAVTMTPPPPDTTKRAAANPPAPGRS